MCFIRRPRILALIATCLTSPAWATPYFEMGDDGEGLGSAQAIGVGVDVIYGSTTSFTADLYSFYWAGGALTLDTFGSATDTQLFLFNGAGQGVLGNDQASAFESDSLIVDPALAAGQYFVGVSLFDFDPYSIEGEIFPSAPFNGLFGPSNGSPLDHWAKRSGHSVPDGSYVVHFNQPTGIPEPSTLSLMLFAIVLASVRSFSSASGRHRALSNLLVRPEPADAHAPARCVGHASPVSQFRNRRN